MPDGDGEADRRSDLARDPALRHLGSVVPFAEFTVRDGRKMHEIEASRMAFSAL
jgi:hypothetical protein